MKICAITNAFAPEKTSLPQKIGGAEVCAERISRGLLAKGHSVVVITQRRYSGPRSLLPKAEIKNGLKVYSFYPLNIFSIYNTHKKNTLLKGLWRIIDLINPLPAVLVFLMIKNEQPDIIHNHILHGFSPFFLLRLLKLTKIPVVQSLHSYGFLCLRCDFLRHHGELCKSPPFLCRLFIALSRFFTRGMTDMVISPSHFCLGLYKEYGFFLKSRTIVLPNAVETYAENPHRKKQAEEGKFKVLYAGRLVKIKGVHILIEAFKGISSADAELTIVGEGYFERELKMLAADDHRISFLGKIPWTELNYRYQNSDVTVVPSIYYEILGNVVIESMSCGTPVIASRIGGITELIEDGRNGYLVESGDVRGLKAALEQLLAKRSLLERLGEEAFLSAKKYDIRTHVAEIEKLYLSLKNA